MTLGLGSKTTCLESATILNSELGTVTLKRKPRDREFLGLPTLETWFFPEVLVEQIGSGYGGAGQISFPFPGVEAGWTQPLQQQQQQQL